MATNMYRAIDLLGCILLHPAYASNGKLVGFLGVDAAIGGGVPCVIQDWHPREPRVQQEHACITRPEPEMTHKPFISNV